MTKKLRLMLLGVCTLLASTTMNLSPSFAGDNRESIDSVFPVGSVTCFVELNIGGGADDTKTFEIKPVTNVDEARKVREYIRKDVRMLTFSVTVWNDGTIDFTDPVEATPEQADKLYDRMSEKLRESRMKAAPPPPPVAAKAAAGAKKIEDGGYSADDQCHARTKTGERCKNNAKGTTGFCWRHQNCPDAYPNKK